MVIKGLFLVILAYLFGSIPTGVILSRTFGGVDIQEEGSGNIGATNVYRVIGKRLGTFTLLGDILKGFIPVLLTRWVTASEVWMSLAALAAFLGHLYPLFLGFRGGKGIATALGTFLALTPLVIFLNAIIFVLVVYRFRYVSLGSLVSAGAMPILLGLFTDSKIYLLLSLVMGGFIYFRHQENIQRLLEKKERKLEI